MCGICGITNFSDPRVIETMNETLVHRGPDDSGSYISEDQGIALGHRRLSIIDLSPRGHQPMCDDRGEIWLVFNGEIYNFAEIKSELEGRGYHFRSRSDAEVVIYAYREWGYHCLERFNGMFALAIWDRRDRSLFLARDRLGIKPLFFAHWKQHFLFASEMKAILALPGFPREIDADNLYSNLILSWTPGPKTAFRHIEKLDPGHYLIWKNGQLGIHPYWELRPSPAAARDEREWVEELRWLLKDAVRLQMLADVPVGAFLSGGLDSSALVAYMSSLAGAGVRSYTIRFEADDMAHEKMPDDSRYARMVAEHFGTRHHEITIRPEIAGLLPKMIWHNEDLVTDSAAINTYLIARTARDEGTKVLLNGMGADEIFGGYRKYLSSILARLYRRFAPSFARRRVIEPMAARLPVAGKRGGFRYSRWAKRFFRNASLDDLHCFIGNAGFYNAREMESLLNRAGSFDFEGSYAIGEFKRRFELTNGMSYLARMCYLDTLMYLPDWNLNYSDKAAMAASVESRPPLVDHRIVEFAFALPDRLRIRGQSQKYILKKALAGLLPDPIINRPKAPFGAPLRSWMKGGLADLVDDCLSERTVRERGWFDAGFIRKLVEDNRAGRHDHAHRLWNLVNMELWFRTFLDGKVTPA